jgi:uncharacterized protein (TIGR03382 family)
MKLVRTFVALVVCFSALLASKAALAANWYDSAPSRMQHLCQNWVSQTNEDLLWAYAGFQDVDSGNGTRLPQTNEVYYVRVIMAGLGCSGAWARPELKLPKGTSLAISTSNPVRCYSAKISDGIVKPLTDCPTGPTQGQQGTDYYAFPPPQQPYWPLPASVVYIEVPVISTTPLSGIATNDYLVAAVNVIDNNPGGGNPPWTTVQQGVFVTQAGSPRSPYVGYADNSATPGTTTATTDMTIYNYDCVAGGNLQADLLPVVNQPDSSAFVSGSCVSGCCTAPCGVGASSTWRFAWSSLTPDRDYKWRGYLTSLQIAGGCSSTLADAQTNASAPQFAFFRTQSTSTPPTAYVLMLHGSAGGTLAASPQPPNGQTRYAPGTQVTVTATPDTGYVLSSLLVDGNAATAPVTITMSADHAVDAVFDVDTTASPDAGGGTDGGSSSGSDGGASGGGGGGGCNTSGGSGTSALALVLGALGLALRRRRA